MLPGLLEQRLQPRPVVLRMLVHAVVLNVAVNLHVDMLGLPVPAVLLVLFRRLLPYTMLRLTVVVVIMGWCYVQRLLD